MSTHRSDTLDEALIQLELEEDDVSVEHRRAQPPPVPKGPPGAKNPPAPQGPPGAKNPPAPKSAPGAKAPPVPGKAVSGNPTPPAPSKTVPRNPTPPPTPAIPTTEPLESLESLETLEADEDEDTARTALRGSAMPPRELAGDAQSLIQLCFAELERSPDAQKVARLHCDIAYAYEEILRDPGNAIKHYEEALAVSPESLPAIRGARRVYLAAGEYKQALTLFETEARLTPDVATKAMLHYERARLLENFTGRVAEAKKTYDTALALDPSNLSIVSATKRTAMRTGNWQEVSQAYQRAANLVEDDARLRAAILVERARLAESQFGDMDSAIELAESALRIDPHVLGALESLERLYYKRQEWGKLARVFERQAERTTDGRVRSLSLHELGRVQAERLGDDVEAQRSLVRAAEATDNRDRQILDELAQLYERLGEHERAAGAVRALLEIVPTSDEQVALMHKLGGLYERQLDDEEHAIRFYQGALDIDPTHQPTLQALAALYTRREDWRPLIEMHQSEADAIESVERRAAAHGRIGEIHEVHLEHPIDATIHYERALALDPTHSHSFRALTRLYARAGRYRDLVEHYERALDNAPNKDYKLTYLTKIGSLWEDTLSDPKQAAYAYRRLLRIDPRHMGAIHALQRVTEQAGQYRELVDAMELEVRECSEPEVEVALLHRAGLVLDEKLGDRDGALVRYKQVLERDPSYAPVLVSMGRLYYREGRWADLLGVYERQLELTTDDRTAAIMLYKMGQLCELRLARPKDAVSHYRQATNRNPGYQPAVNALARLVRQRQEWSDVLDAIELQLAAAADDDTRAMLLLLAGRLDEERLGQPARALERYRSALSAKPDSWPVIHALARLRSEQGEWKPLLEDLDRQSQGTMDPLVAGAALMRQGDVLFHHLHDPQSAIVRFESLVDSNPGKLPALLSLEHLYAKTEVWEALAAVYEAESDAVADKGAKIAALRELLNVQQGRGLGGAREIDNTLRNILALDPHDFLALDSVYQSACANDDPRRLAEASKALANHADDRFLAARYLTSMGQALERVGGAGALDAYAEALEKDPDALAATRGLARTARALGDHEAEVMATRREAAIVAIPRAVSELLFHSAELRLDHLGDPQSAIADLEQALDAWPENLRAAKRLEGPLLAAGDIDRLLNILSRSAGRADDVTVAARHWLAVAMLHLEQLGDEGAAIAALRRGLGVDPTHVSSLRRLAEIFIRDRRYQEAIELYERVIEVSANRNVLCDTYLRLASLVFEHSEKPERALDHYKAVLDIDPYHREALIQVGEYHLRLGDGEAAVRAARRMINAAPDTESRTWALVQLARIEIRLEAPERAESALIEALALEGPGGEAASEFRQLIEGSGSWVGYAAGLSGFVQRGVNDRQRLAKAYLELGEVYGDHIGQPAQAATKLEEGLEVTGGDPEIAYQLSRRLCDAGRYHEGIAQLQTLAAADVTRTEVWRTLSQTFDKLSQTHDAILNLAPLVILQTADSQERGRWYARTPRPAEAPPGIITFETLPHLAADNVMASCATEMIAALSEGLGRLYRPDLEAMGISRRDRISSRSRHPIRALADRVAAIFGVEFDLYLHPRTTPLASLEMTEPVSVVIAEHVADLPVSQQVFLLATCMTPIAGRYYPAERLPKRELALLLAATTSLLVPGYRPDLPEEDVNAHAQRVKKVIPRRWRRNLELAAAEYATRPIANLGHWKRALRLTSMRAGLLIADDPIGVVDVLRDDDEMLEARGAELLRRSPRIADMVCFWASPAALALRRELGLPR